MNKILKYLHNKTKLDKSYFDKYKLFTNKDVIKVKVNHYTFLKSRKLFKLKVYCFNNIHFLIGKILYGNLLTSRLNKLNLWLSWKYKNKKYLLGSIKWYSFNKYKWIVKEALMTKEDKKKKARKIFESYGYSKEKIDKILLK